MENIGPSLGFTPRDGLNLRRGLHLTKRHSYNFPTSTSAAPSSEGPHSSGPVLSWGFDSTMIDWFNPEIKRESPMVSSFRR